MNMPMLCNAANKVYALDQVGGVPIYGITPQWFVDEFLEFCKIKPEAANWDQRQVESTMAGLWILDPEDLI